METMEKEADLSSGYKLVPWSSWDQWNFVRESLFSSSPDSVSKALQKISAWRSRGCLPVPIDVTAAFVEIQQKDQFFSKGENGNSMISEEMLAMLYCMATMRLVNCFVEPAHKKTGRSIAQLAEAAGIPRVLVDIRHESSHRGLPSLPLVRSASVKALDWLKSTYWEPQRYAILDVQKKIRSRLREMILFLKNKNSLSHSRPTQINTKRAKRLGVLMAGGKLSSQIAVQTQVSKYDGSRKKLSKMAKSISQDYSSYPSEVVSVLLEFFHLLAPIFSDTGDMEQSDRSSADDMSSLVVSMSDLKIIIAEVSSKKPGLILSIMKALLETMETIESTQFDEGTCHFPTSKCENKQQFFFLHCSLFHWLVKTLKVLKESSQIGIIDQDPVLSTDRNAAPKVSLTDLLRKCLSLLVLGDKHLSDSVLLLAEMIGDDSLTNKLRKIPLPHWHDQQWIEDSKLSSGASMFLQEEACVKQATEKLELLKLRLRISKMRSSTDNKDTTDGSWVLVKSWIPCPIGMIPCSFSSTPVLPLLDKVDDSIKLNESRVTSNLVDTEVSFEYVLNNHMGEINESDGITDEYASSNKRLRMSSEVQESYLPKTTNPFEGCLLIGGTWKKVSQDELIPIESSIRIFV